MPGMAQSAHAEPPRHVDNDEGFMEMRIPTDSQSAFADESVEGICAQPLKGQSVEQFLDPMMLAILRAPVVNLPPCQDFCTIMDVKEMQGVWTITAREINPYLETIGDRVIQILKEKDIEASEKLEKQSKDCEDDQALESLIFAATDPDYWMPRLWV